VNQVKKVRITLCTFRTATSSPDPRNTEFFSNYLQQLQLPKSPRKKGQIGRERLHLFGPEPPKKFSGSLPPFLRKSRRNIDRVDGRASWTAGHV
jgi:hypothetical protein